jgi:hypothetical protein
MNEQGKVISPNRLRYDEASSHKLSKTEKLIYKLKRKCLIRHEISKELGRRITILKHQADQSESKLSKSKELIRKIQETIKTKSDGTSSIYLT